jgi:hypothetical protein
MMETAELTHPATLVLEKQGSFTSNKPTEERVWL